MPKLILIVYDSFSGSTAEIATRMKSTIEADSGTAKIIAAENRSISLQPYDLIIIGSAIRGGNPHPNIKLFIDANQSELSKKNVAIFAACITITSSKEKLRKNAASYPKKIAQGLKPIAEAVFAGNAPDSGKFGNFMGKLLLGVVPGDYRDWNAITSWTKSLID